jgi:hypothetical protein
MEKKSKKKQRENWRKRVKRNRGRNGMQRDERQIQRDSSLIKLKLLFSKFCSFLTQIFSTHENQIKLKLKWL